MIHGMAATVAYSRLCQLSRVVCTTTSRKGTGQTALRRPPRGEWARLAPTCSRSVRLLTGTCILRHFRGGNMLPAQGGGWDLFVSEIPAGLANWGHQSTCVHATAPNRSGPFVRRSVALGAECHNAQVLSRRDAEGYLLFNWPAKSQWVAHSVTADGPFTRMNTSAVPICNNPSPGEWGPVRLSLAQIY